MDIPRAANTQRPAPSFTDPYYVAKADPRSPELAIPLPDGRVFLRIFPSGTIHCAAPRQALQHLDTLHHLHPVLRTALRAALRLLLERAEPAPSAPPVTQPYPLDDPRVQRLRQGGARVTFYSTGDRLDRFAVLLPGGAAPICECSSHAQARAEALRLAPDYPGRVLQVAQILETMALTVEPAPRLMHEDDCP